MSIYDVPLRTLEGNPGTLADHAGEVLLIVNVASKCGLTPQYETLETLQRTYADRGFSVLGFPATSSAARSRGPRRRSRPSARRPTA
jgi:glutathione peroxidase